MTDTRREVQTILKARGYSLGSSGPNRDGIDGNPGDLTFAAILAELIRCGGAVARSPIDLVSVAVLRAACPERSDLDLSPWAEPIRAACRRFEINTIRRIAAFVAQMAHESGMKPGREESFAYSAQRMAEVWPARYAVDPKATVKRPNALAVKLAAAGPQAIANNVYANRMGNGDEASGDGWANRGAGPGQLTGGDNWKAFAAAMNMPLADARAWARTIEGASFSLTGRKSISFCWNPQARQWWESGRVG